MARKPKNEKETVQEVITESADEVIETPVEEIVKQEESVEKEYTISCDGYLRVRRGPGKDYDVVKELPSGETVTVSETNGPWGKIGPDRWVMMEFLK